VVHRNEKESRKSLRKSKKQWITAGVTVGLTGLIALSPKAVNSSTWTANNSETTQTVESQNSFEVNQGDTLWSLSSETNVNIQTLADLNGLNLSEGGQGSLPTGRMISFDGMDAIVTDKSTGEVISRATLSRKNLVNAQQQPGERVDESVPGTFHNGEGLSGGIEIANQQGSSENNPANNSRQGNEANVQQESEQAEPGSTTATRNPETAENADQPVQQNSSSTELDANVIESELIRLVNELRASVGVQPVTQQSQLTQGAFIRAEEQSQSFAHTRPDGTSWRTTFDEVGYSGTVYGENLVSTTADFSNETEAAQYLFDLWKESPSHYENMVNPEYNQIGIGVVQIDGYYYGAQLLGAQ